MSIKMNFKTIFGEDTREFATMAFGTPVENIFAQLPSRQVGDSLEKEEEEENSIWQPKLEEKPKPRQQYNVLLFGETGSGKSTLINYLTNYFLGGSLTNLKIAIPTKHHKATEGLNYSEKDLDDTTKSKTRDCIDYAFPKDDVCFNFIDTPKLSDTEGSTKDDEHIVKIMTAAEERGNLTAIVIVINGTVARATGNLRNTLTLLKGSVPYVLLKNLVVVLTNCSKATANFNLKHLEPWKVPEDNVFYMNNSALCFPVDVWQNDKEMMDDLVNHWKKSMEVVEGFIEKIKQLGDKATYAFLDMRLKIFKIKAQLQGILLEMKKLQTMQDELICAQSAEKNVATDIQKYSNYKQSKQVEYEELEDADYHSTICFKHTKVCHDGCGLEYTPTQGADIFKGCACMSGSHCKQCGCGHSTHYHDKKKQVKKTKTVDDILHDVKALYDKHTGRKVDLQKKITDLSADIASLKHALDSKEVDIQKCCEELKTLCSQFHFMDELQSIIDIMERDARTLTNVDVRKDAESRINNFIHLASLLAAVCFHLSSRTAVSESSLRRFRQAAEQDWSFPLVCAGQSSLLLSALPTACYPCGEEKVYFDMVEIKHTVRFAFPTGSARPTYEEIAQFVKSLDASIPDIDTVYKRAVNQSVYLKFKSEKAFKAALENNTQPIRFHYANGTTVLVEISDAGNNFQYVRVCDLPPELPDRDVSLVLEKYGIVKRVVREKFPSGLGLDVFNGVRGIFMDVRTELPRALHFLNWEGNVFYPGNKDKCFICAQKGQTEPDIFQNLSWFHAPQ